MMSRTFAICASLSIALHVGFALFMVSPRPREVDIDIEPVPALAGETFEVPSAPSDPTSTPTSAPTSIPEAPTAAAQAPESRVTRAARSRGEGRAPEPPKQFGAVGERGASDVVVAFGRAIAQVASADPEWTTTPFGDTGVVDVTLAIDDAGALVRAAIGGGGSAPMRRAVERTIAFVRGRTFTASAPEVRLRVHARTNPDTVHDGLHGDVFAIGASSDGHTAFFALSIGRRVDMDVDVAK